ncbi:MAG: hypothetical protein U9N39_08835 [Campylobacterota bacterium]|nr:hypothetical protein [Campylobacterota bacterium]
MNYKKSILSLAAVIALGSVSLADTNAQYLPLAVDNGSTGDASWILFGVNGFSNGVPSNAVAGPTSFASGYTSLTDTDTADDVATEGLTVSSKNLASLQGLQEDNSLSALAIAVNITGVTYEETEPVRSMYVKVNSSAPNMKFNYKASLEGKNMQIIKNGSTTTVYEVTISQESTWNNALEATVVDGSGGGGNTDDLTTILETLDTNTTNNPINPANWDKTVHNVTTVANSNFYKFDAITQQWKVYKNLNSEAANDFDTFEAGSAYWGRVDVADAVPTIDGDSDAALILGKPTAQAQSALPLAYLDENNVSKLTEGWNMVSFNEAKPYIRRAATGLVLDSISEDDNVTITDDTGVYSTGVITLLLTAEEDWAKLINTTIESQKLRGILPDTFDVKAFATENAKELVLISDKKFGITSNGTGKVKTLLDANPFVNGAATAVTDISDAAATVYSAYGEFAVMANILTGAGTVDGIATGSATAGANSKIIFGDSLNGDHTAIEITDENASSFGDAITDIPTNAKFVEDTFVPKLTGVDTDFDGTADMMIVAEAQPFYMRDATFTRVFKTTTTAANDTLAFTITGAAAVEIEPSADDNASAVAIEVNDDVGTTEIYAEADSGATKLVLATTSTSTFSVADVPSATVDFLEESTVNEDIAKGAIKGVYSLDELAKLPLKQYSWSTDFESKEQPKEDNNTINIIVGTDVNITNQAYGAGASTDSAAGRKIFFDNIVNGINDAVRSAGIHAYASHDFTEAIDDFRGTTIIVSGIDASTFTIEDGNITSDGVDSIPDAPTNSNDGISTELGTLTGDLVSDLKFNAVYTPNYANYGPLYTMRDSGYDVKAVLRATTDLTSNDGAITWDSIDITRDEDDWFIQNEFNLFGVNGKSGYWVYLEGKSEDSIAIGTPSYAPTYQYYFANDTDKTTTNNIVGGAFTVEVTGINLDTDGNVNPFSVDGTASNVYLMMEGEEVQMKRNSDTVYSADITKFESVDFDELVGGTSFSIRATDGKGKSLVSTDALNFDYEKPAAPAPTYTNASSVIFTSTSTDTSKFYLFEDYIPELPTARTNAIKAEVDAAAGSGTTNVCALFDFATVNTLRVIGADGDGGLGTANVSDATEFNYATLFKGASVISHLNDGTADKSTLATVYDDTCTLAATQPVGSENTGVSIKALISGKLARISYVADETKSFDTDLAWDAIYELPDGTDVIQLQNVADYASDAFLVEYEGNLYSGNFPANQAAADATVGTPGSLTLVNAANKLLVP